MEHMRCNRCGTSMQAKSQVIAATCHHMFCTNCAQDLLDADEPCPMCEGCLTRSNVKQVTIMQSSSNLQLCLCGQTPQTIMEAALSGIKFYCEQQRLNAQYEQNALSKKFVKMQNQCKSKLEQVHQGYLQAKRKYQETVQDRNAIQQDVEELQQKYTQKALQTRKLQDMFKALQQEHDELKRRCTGGRGSGGGLAGAAGQLVGSGRQPSPFGAGPTQITTVHQRQSVIELSPTAAAFVGHGSATVPQQRPRTAGNGFGHNVNMFNSGSPGLQPPMPHRPTTGSGGMFGSTGNRASAPGGSAMRLNMPRGTMGLASPQGMLSM